MHYQALLTVELPTVKRDPEYEQKMKKRINTLRSLKEKSVTMDVLSHFLMEHMVCVSTAFGRDLAKIVYEVMDEFSHETENPMYLCFEDNTEEYLKQYNQKIDCIKFADGHYVEPDVPSVNGKFMIRNGKVFQMNAGPLKHPKRTKRAKRMKAVLDCHRKKVYGNFHSFVYEFCYGVKNEETGKYGIWYNPNAQHDGFQIKGKRSTGFLVSENCEEICFGEREHIDSEQYPAPEGYLWVNAARKKDIQWQAMREWFNTENIRIPKEWKYPFGAETIFSRGKSLHLDDRAYNEDKEKWVNVDWHAVLDEFVDDLDENTVLVNIDYHW